MKPPPLPREPRVAKERRDMRNTYREPSLGDPGLATEDVIRVKIPATKPATELLDGTFVQKTLPVTAHAFLQGRLLELLMPWARTRGFCGPEWRFRLNTVGTVSDSVVPDIAFLSFERWAKLTSAQREFPPFEPDVAIEILSPDDRPGRVAKKVAKYVNAGTQLVLVFDPASRRLVAHDRGSSHTYAEAECFSHPAVPGSTLELADVFSALDVLG
jgi:Uma2 family endonuclease